MASKIKDAGSAAPVSEFKPPGGFEGFARKTAIAMGRPATFWIAIAVVLIWAKLVQPAPWQRSTK